MNKYLIVGAGVLSAAVLVFILTMAPAPSGTKTEVQPSAQPTTQQTNEKTVNATKKGFEPEILKVTVGTKVTFINKSDTTADVSSAIHPTHALFPLLNLGTFNDGGSLSVKFDKQGTYKYHNHLNPSQTGEVVVE